MVKRYFGEVLGRDEDRAPTRGLFCFFRLNGKNGRMKFTFHPLFFEGNSWKEYSHCIRFRKSAGGVSKKDRSFF